MSVNATDIDTVRASYERCCQVPDFIKNFYDRFFEVCPEAKPKFADTDFQRQRQLLRHAIGLLVTYAQNEEDELLERIAEKHDRHHVAARPEQYPLFLKALTDTIESTDPRADEATLEAWRQVLAPGVEFMSSRY